MRHLLEGHHYLEEMSIQEIEASANKKDALLDAIKKVEEQGLPLRKIIEAPEPPPRRYVGLPLDEDGYILPEAYTPNQLWDMYEAWLEQQYQAQEWNRERMRSYQQATAYDEFL